MTGAASPLPPCLAFRAAVEASAAAEDAAGPPATARPSPPAPPAIAAWSAHGAGVVVAPAVAVRLAGADRDER